MSYFGVDFVCFSFCFVFEASAYAAGVFVFVDVLFWSEVRSFLFFVVFDASAYAQAPFFLFVYVFCFGVDWFAWFF